jgi:hypothetical protein
VVGTVQHCDGVGEEIGDGVEGFDRAFGAAGKIDDERAMTDDGYAARQDGGGSLLGTFAAKFFGDARNGAFGDVERGFGSIVARAEAGATGGEDEIDTARVGEFAKLATEASGIVGTAKRGGDFPAEFTNAFDQSWAGKIFAFTAGDGVADGENGDTHGSGLFYMRRKGKARRRCGVCAKGTGRALQRVQRGSGELKIEKTALGAALLQSRLA